MWVRDNACKRYTRIQALALNMPDKKEIQIYSESDFCFWYNAKVHLIDSNASIHFNK